MPLDIRRFRYDPCLFYELERSLCLRRRRRTTGQQDDGDDASHIDNDDDHDKEESSSSPKSIVTKFRECDSQVRTALQKLNAYRCEMNKNNKKRKTNKKMKNRQEEPSVAASSVNNNNNNNNKQRLKQLQQSYDDCQQALDDFLKKLPNLIDDHEQEIMASDDSEDDQQQHQIDKRCTTKTADADANGDIFFCIGGYEELMNNNSIVLTGVGMELLRDLEQTVLNFVTSNNNQLIVTNCSNDNTAAAAAPLRIWHLPSYSTATSTSTCMHQGEAEEVVPSWKVLLGSIYGSNGQQTTLFDKALPQCHVLVCRGNNTSTNDSINNKSKRKKQRKNPGGRCWYDRLHSSMRTEIQLLIVTGSSLKADSRPIQISWIHNIRDFYQRLLPNMNLTVRWLLPEHLEPSQASCVILEAQQQQYYNSSQLSLHNNKSQFSVLIKGIELASISNYLDYESNNIRHGHMDQGVHILHGRLCPLEECLECLLQCSSSSSSLGSTPAVDEATTTPCLQIGGLWPQPRTFPFQRTVRRSKKGQRIVVPIPHQQHGQQRKPAVSKNREDGDQKKAAAKLPVSSRNGSLTPEEIRLEASSCPFDFLPLYYR